MTLEYDRERIERAAREVRVGDLVSRSWAKPEPVDDLVIVQVIEEHLGWSLRASERRLALDAYRAAGPPG